MCKKLVEAVEGQVKSAIEEGRCKPDSWSKPEKSSLFRTDHSNNNPQIPTQRRLIGLICSNT